MGKTIKETKECVYDQEISRINQAQDQPSPEGEEQFHVRQTSRRFDLPRARQDQYREEQSDVRQAAFRWDPPEDQFDQTPQAHGIFEEDGDFKVRQVEFKM